MTDVVEFREIERPREGQNFDLAFLVERLEGNDQSGNVTVVQATVDPFNELVSAGNLSRCGLVVD